MNNKIIALVGFSSAGKDTLAKYAHDNLGYNFVVSHSTRPMRAGESQGIHIISLMTMKCVVYLFKIS